MLPQALIVHQTRERVRLRIREKRDDTAYFEEVQGRLGSDSALHAEVNRTTGSILISHPHQRWSEVAHQLTGLGLFEIVDHIEQEPALVPIMTGIEKFEKGIAEISSGSIDLRTLGFILLFGFALRQIVRGEILGPGLPLLWSALDLARMYQQDGK